MDIQQLEEYKMKHTLPEEKAQDGRALAIKEEFVAFSRLMAYYRCAMMEVETKFKVIDQDFSWQYERNPIENIKTRLKKPSSIQDKLKRYNKPFTVQSIEENLHDVAGVRVVCSFIDDVYKIADTLLKQDDVVLIRRKDYIAHPKENGYRSLHLIVSIPIFLTNEKKMMTVEIQLRTIAMNFWASLEHQLRYKKDNIFTAEMAQDLNQCAEVSAQLDDMMNGLCTRIYDCNVLNEHGSTHPVVE